MVVVRVAVGVPLMEGLGVSVGEAVAVGEGTTPAYSNAPISQALPSAGRGAPRWSVAGQSAVGIASIAKLGESTAMVSVSPPLFARPSVVSRFRLPSVTLSPIVSPLEATLCPNPQELSSEIL